MQLESSRIKKREEVRERRPLTTQKDDTIQRRGLNTTKNTRNQTMSPLKKGYR